MSENICEICGKTSCDNEWECHVEMYKRAGNSSYTPNNLPIRCIRADGLMLEHEHGDHKDYIFPVSVEYIGPITEDRYQVINGLGEVSIMDDDWKYLSDHEEHALIYANSGIAVTIYECCYSVWSLSSSPIFKEGKCIGDEPAGLCMGSHLLEIGKWKLSEESLKKIEVYNSQEHKRLEI
jgi:hypothetical protein